MRTATCQNPGCNTPLSEGVEWDHIKPVSLGGDNSDDNCQALCPECHQLKTSGPKHYSKGSDTNKAASIKRHQNGGKKVRHPMQKTGQKFQSRPFKSDWQPNTKWIDADHDTPGDT